MKYLFLLFFVNIIFSQSNCGIIRYEIINKNAPEGISPSKYDMFFSPNESLYIYNEEENENKVLVMVNGKVISSDQQVFVHGKPVSTGSDIAPMYNYKLNQEYITFQSEVAYKKVITTDNFKIEWNISEHEQKEIGGFVCKKATTTFRGVDYIVWFTEEIPLPFGPWKFRNLNGLILEVYDKDRNYIYIATQINLGKDCKEINNTISKYDLSDTIPWEKYVELYKNEEREIQRQNRANTPRGANPGSTTIIRAALREIIFD